MADPLSLVAIAGLAYAGKKLSESRAESYQGPEQQVPQRFVQEEVPSISLPKPTVVSNVPQHKIEISNFGDIVPQTRSSGGEVLEMRNRMFDGGRMNNLE